MPGNWWDQDPVVKTVPSRAGVFTPKPPDPTAPYKGPTSAAELAKIQAQIAEMRAAEERRQTDAAKDAEKESEAARKSIIQQQLSNDDILKAIGAARDKVNGWSTGLPGQVLSHAWGTDATDLDSSLSTIKGNTMLTRMQELKDASPTGATGLGQQTEREGKALSDSIAPLSQGQSVAQLKDSLAQVELHYRRFQALTHGQNPDDPEVAKQFGIAAAPKDDKDKTPPSVGGQQGGGGGPPKGYDPWSDPSLQGGPAQTLAPGKMEMDPGLAGVNTMVRGWIQDGKPSSYIREQLNAIQPGMGDKVILNLESSVEYQKQHPRWTPDVNLEGTWKPATGAAKVIGEIGMSPAGTAIAKAGNAVTMGALPYLSGDSAKFKATMGGLEQMNPNAAMFGDIGGNIVGTAMTGGILGRVPGAAGRMLGSPLGADAVYGAGLGYNQADPGNGAWGAIEGAAANAAGGMFGSKVMGAGGRALKGITDPNVGYLAREGVQMTPGQMTGGGFKRAEDRLIGRPGLGDKVQGKRLEGYDSFNQAAFRQGGAPIGFSPTRIGEQGAMDARKAASDSYGALDQITLQADNPFMAALTRFQQAGQKIPGELGQEFQNTLESRVGPFIDPQTGLIPGRNAQAIIQGVRKDMSALSKAPRYDLYREQANNLIGATRGLVERQAPGVVPKFDAANAAWRNQGILGDAVTRGANTGGRFTPAQLGQAAVKNAKQFGGSGLAASTERPFFEIQRAAQEVLPSQIPDSGTAGRMEQSGSLFNRGYNKMKDAAIAPIYDMDQETLRRILLERSERARALGQFAIKNQRLGGLGAGAGLLQYQGN